MSSNSIRRHRLPLPDNFFSRPPLLPEDISRLTELADSMAHQVILNSNIVDGPIAWALERDQYDVRMYKGSDPTVFARNYVWTTEMFGSIDDIASMYTIQPNDSTSFRTYCREHHFNAVDGQQLYVVEPSPDHYIGIHYAVTHMPGCLKNNDLCLVKLRDWCFLETHSHFNLGDGRRGWVRSFTSIDLPCCPQLTVSHGFIRAKFIRAGYIFVESPTREGYLDVTQLLQVDLKGKLNGHLSEWVVSMDMQRRHQAMTALDTSLRRHRLSLTPFLSDDEVVPRCTRYKCYHCHVHFNLFVTSGRCRKCGEVMCMHCSKVWSFRRGSFRVCTTCALGKPSGQIVSQQPLPRQLTTAKHARRIPASVHRIIQSIRSSDASFYSDSLPPNAKPILPRPSLPRSSEATQRHSMESVPTERNDLIPLPRPRRATEPRLRLL